MKDRVAHDGNKTNGTPLARSLIYPHQNQLCQIILPKPQSFAHRLEHLDRGNTVEGFRHIPVVPQLQAYTVLGVRPETS